MVRSVIGLKPETEDALREELKRIEGQIECADTEKTNIEQDLHDQLRHALRILREQVDFVLPNPQVGVDLPTLLVTDFFTSMKDEVDQTEKNRQSARQARLANTLSVKKYLDSLKEKETILIHKKESTTARERLSTSASSELKELLAVMEENPMCPANKLISECDHVQALRKTYEQQEALKHSKVLSFSSDVEEREYERRCEEIERIERQYNADKATLEELLQKENVLKKSEDKLYKDFLAICSKYEWLKELWNTLQSSWYFLYIGEKNEATEGIIRTLCELNEEKSTNKGQLVQLRSEIESRSQNIEVLFSEMVKYVIHEACTGKLVIQEEKCDFTIFNHTKNLDKGAMKVLSIILGDIACLLSARNEVQYHPGFLMHDSPRNAELTSVMYNNVLKYLIEFAAKYGKYENVPFQYIASMTGEPTEELKSFVRIRLASDPVDKLLFKNKLIPKEQGML